MNLDKADRKTIGEDLQTVEYGWPIGMPLCKPLGSGLWEVRSNISDGRIARVIWFAHNEKMVLLHAFIKKTQQTPLQDKRLAAGRKRSVENG